MASPYGGFWIRFGAYLLDSIPFVILYFIAAAILIGSVASSVHCSVVNDRDGFPTTSCTGDATGAGGAVALVYLILLVAHVGYFVAMWARGGTFGQRILGLKVVDANTGQNISLGKAFVRYLGFILSSIPFDLGLIWAGFDPRKQGWHDKIASTLVVRR